jgi:hypothetical protein
VAKFYTKLDKAQTQFLELYFGRLPMDDDIKTLIRLALPDFPEDIPPPVKLIQKRPDGTVEIPLSPNGKHAGKYVALVSEKDEDLANFTWHVQVQKTGTYAKRVTGTVNTRMLHTVVLERILGRELERHELADHINGDGLDNRRNNLRVATKSQNMQNKRIGSNNTSGYKGVSWANSIKKWVAQIRVNGKTIILGYFDEPESAYEAYCKAAKEHYGEFANFG